MSEQTIATGLPVGWARCQTCITAWEKVPACPVCRGTRVVRTSGYGPGTGTR